jgi:hypothetical protein
VFRPVSWLAGQYSKSLLPWRTVEQNVALVFESKGMKKRDIAVRCVVSWGLSFLIYRFKRYDFNSGLDRF